MEVELDALLAEVEAKYLRPPPSRAAPVPDPAPASTRPRTRDAAPRDDVEEALRDVEEAVAEAEAEAALAAGDGGSAGWGGGGACKCFPVAFVGGSDVPPGLSSAARTRACDALHCTACDLRVRWLDGVRWRPPDQDQHEALYLALRTYMPWGAPLRERLARAPGWRAYACHCRHLSSRQLQQLQSNSCRPLPPWRCRGHCLDARRQRP